MFRGNIIMNMNAKIIFNLVFIIYKILAIIIIVV